MRWALALLAVTLVGCSSTPGCQVPAQGYRTTTVHLAASTGDTVGRTTEPYSGPPVEDPTTSTTFVVTSPELDVAMWAPVGRDVAVVGTVDDHWFAARVDPSTGRARWTRRLPWAAHDLAADGQQVVAVLSGSFGKDIVLALDPATGRIGWEHSLDLPGDPTVALASDEVVVTADDHVDCS